MNWTNIAQFLQEKAASIGLEIVGAILLCIIGRWLIAAVVGAVQRVLTKQRIEPTVLRFAGNSLSVALHITLGVAILGYFGVQTTTFAALLAAAFRYWRSLGRPAGQFRRRRFPAGAAPLQSG